MEQRIKDLLAALNHKETARVPVVVWGPIAPSVTSYMGVKPQDYYLKAEVKLKTQLSFLEAFPDVVGIPGLWPDFGAIGLPSTMGCPTIWLDDDAPVARPMLTDIDDVLQLKAPDPTKEGYLAVELQQWEYFWRNTDKKFIEAYGYLDGVAEVMGPVETAGLMRGYTEFFIDTCLSPRRTHQLLEIITETIIKYLRACEKINGKLKRLAVADHVPSQISPEHFREFWLPYVSSIFREFSYAEIRLWHNEGPSKHVFPYLKDLGANVWHFGEDTVAEAKQGVGDFLCLMGNLSPVGHLVDGDYDSVLAAAQEVIKTGAKGGGLWLSSGGGMAPKTPQANIQALIDAAARLQK